MVGRRESLEALYAGLCDVFEYSKIKDPVTKVTKSGEVKVHEALKCRLSFSNAPVADHGEAADKLRQLTKLFLAPEVIIKAGSKIVVTQNGRTFVYSCAGEPMVYADHQEITLSLFKEYA